MIPAVLEACLPIEGEVHGDFTPPAIQIKERLSVALIDAEGTAEIFQTMEPDYLYGA